MKYISLLTTILSAATLLVSAAPCRDHSNHVDNSNHEDNSENKQKEIHQTVGSVGSDDHDAYYGGLLGALVGEHFLEGGILSSTTKNTYVTQNAHNN